jgi:hypothetical protein
MAAPTTGTPTANSKWRLDVDLDPNGTGNFVQVKGMSQFVPSVPATVQDLTDYDTDGWGADAVMGRKFQLTGTVRRNKYGGSRDAGQEALRSAADATTLIHVCWYERTTGGEAYDGWVLVQWEPQGGDAFSVEEVGFTLLGQGARTAITNPHSATAVPVVNSLSPATGGIAGGTLVQINGSGFSTVTGATGVKFGTVNATSYKIVSDSIIVATAPAQAASTKDVVVTNPNGVNVNTTADDYIYV